jgi:hypothetical protein
MVNKNTSEEIRIEKGILIFCQIMEKITLDRIIAEESISVGSNKKTKVSHPYFMGTLGLKCFVIAHKYKKLTLT